jgi:mannose-6-phosphate isomerase-like protein (cupin superfamily)
MIKKTPGDHILHECEYAREMREILKVSEYDKIGLAVGVDLFEMEAHYHKLFDEVFYVLEGNMDCEFYDPDKDKTWTEELSQGDTLVVPKGTHHKVTNASPKNRLMVISIPPWHADDVNPSDKI